MVRALRTGIMLLTLLLVVVGGTGMVLSLIHISEPTRH